jgi:peptidoglycan/xylan/chitin deacetylase (PgdA/CDA1 family)
MKFPGHRWLRLAWLRLRSLYMGGAIVLGYHRIAPPGDDPLGLCVHPSHFDEHLDILRRVGRPVPLAQLVRGLANGDLPARTIAVTFDDGYADNLSAALPLLEKHEIPATCFVVSGTLGREFWWDEAVRLLRGASIASEPPEELAARWIHLSEEERAAQLATLRAKQSGYAHPATARALVETELRQLAKSPLVEIGAHTVSHPMLASMPLDAQQYEIEGSKEALETMLDRPVYGFSYPNGSTGAVTRDLVYTAGFRYACASHYDVIRAGCDPYHLPRFWIEDWDGDCFARWLRWWHRG